MRLTKTKHVLGLFLLTSLLPWLRAETAIKSDFDERPMAVKSVAPEYPAELKAAGTSGLVALSVTIDENGDVTEPVITKSTKAEFEKPALEAIAKWKFKPAKKAGVAVKARVSIPMFFNVGS